MHNLSHSDLVLGVSTGAEGGRNVARPKFSCFKQISEAIYAEIKRNDDNQLAAFQPYSRIGGHYCPEDPMIPAVPAGYDLKHSAVRLEDASSLRFRSDDMSAFPFHQGVLLTAVYFPLIATLLPKWIKATAQQGIVKRLVVLVSGRGQPQDERADHADNSTKYTAKLIAHFIKRAYGMEVELVHSQTNLFRYDENIVFVKRELLPAINKHRDQLVEQYGAAWREHMRITLSFADGSTARISAINASLRHFRCSRLPHLLFTCSYAFIRSQALLHAFLGAQDLLARAKGQLALSPFSPFLTNRSIADL